MPSDSHAFRFGWLWISLMLLLLVGVFVFRLALGSSGIGWPQGEFASHFLQLRYLRGVEAICVGAALAVGGVALQVLLRNPLAEPYILGLSSGAAVGVMAQLLLVHSGLSIGLAIQSSALANHGGALLGSLLSLVIVYLLGQRKGVIDPLGLLLVGVILSAINGSIIMLINYLPGSAGLREDMSRWMMGYLHESLPGSTVWTICIITGIGITILWKFAAVMDAATFPADEAHSLGVRLKRLRIILFLISGVLASGAVVLAGPIAFVGLVCPHVARLLVGPTHLRVIPASALCGAILILVADCFSTWIDILTNRGRLPIGIFTAVIGGISFLWLLRPQLGRNSS
jgi:iron complex transport system permease protein